MILNDNNKLVKKEIIININKNTNIIGIDTLNVHLSIPIDDNSIVNTGLNINGVITAPIVYL